MVEVRGIIACTYAVGAIGCSTPTGVVDIEVVRVVTGYVEVCLYVKSGVGDAYLLPEEYDVACF